MLYCELCGRESAEQKKVLVDGTVFSVCMTCSRLCKPYVPVQVPAKRRKPSFVRRENKIAMSDSLMIDPDFAKLLREARMRAGLTHEQLGMKMNEKAQLLKKFESGALKPDELMAKKLERFLGIKLYVKFEESADDER